MMPEMKPEVTPEPAQELTQEVPQTEVVTEAPPEVIPPALPQTRWQRFFHWKYLGLSVIVLVTLILHFMAIMRPPTIVWDEIWYVGDARSVISGTGELRPEHPPLAKFFIVAGEFIFNGFKIPEHDTGVKTYQYVGGDSSSDTTIDVSDGSQINVGTTIRIESEQMEVKGINPGQNQITVQRGTGGTTVTTHNMLQKIYVFTDNAFGWRFFSIIFGTLGIIIFYFICTKLKFSWKITMVATFLFAFEDMTFVHSGLALLDVYMVTFMLAAVLSYLDENYIGMGIFIALSANCKLVGLFIFIAIFIHWAIYRKDKWKSFSLSIIVTAVAFVVFLTFFDIFIKGGLENPITRINELISGTAANQFTIPKLSISSRPWTWIYPQLVALKNDYNVPAIVYSYDPQYISFISTTIQIMILPTIGYMIYKMIKKSQAAGLVVLWFIATYLVWIPLSSPLKISIGAASIGNRVSFVFYFLAVTPAICIGMAMAISDWLDKLKARRLVTNRTTGWQRTAYIFIAVWLFIHLAIFIVFNPAVPVIIKTWLPPFNIG
jgi:predicted membrane-bound dolichyl-phosphate-mannose-protein mannosyltransferase